MSREWHTLNPPPIYVNREETRIDAKKGGNKKTGQAKKFGSYAKCVGTKQPGLPHKPPRLYQNVRSHFGASPPFPDIGG